MIPLPTVEGGFGAVKADPAWQWLTRSPKGLDGRPQHYARMTLDEIKAIPVAEVCADDAVLFLWITDPLLALGVHVDVCRAWGFEPKTKAFEWVKQNRDGTAFMGGGYWTRANSETCILATRGQPKRLARDVRRLIVSPRREHSRKPDESHARIERLVAGPYLELFAREKRPGWAAWGNETEKFGGE